MDPTQASQLSDQLTAETQQNEAQNLVKQAKNTEVEQDFQTAKQAIQQMGQV